MRKETLHLPLKEDSERSHEAKIHPERYFTKHHPSLMSEEFTLHFPKAQVHAYSIDWLDVNSKQVIGSLYCSFQSKNFYEHVYFADRWAYHNLRGKPIIKTFTGSSFSEDEVTDKHIASFLESVSMLTCKMNATSFLAFHQIGLKKKTPYETGSILQKKTQIKKWQKEQLLRHLNSMHKYLLKNS